MKRKKIRASFSHDQDIKQEISFIKVIYQKVLKCCPESQWFFVLVVCLGYTHHSHPLRNFTCQETFHHVHGFGHSRAPRDVAQKSVNQRQIPVNRDVRRSWENGVGLPHVKTDKSHVNCQFRRASSWPSGDWPSEMRYQRKPPVEITSAIYSIKLTQCCTAELTNSGQYLWSPRLGWYAMKMHPRCYKLVAALFAASSKGSTSIFHWL